MKRTHSPLYLGDGVYAHHDGYHIVLRVPSREPPPEIFLDPSVWNALVAYVASLSGTSEGDEVGCEFEGCGAEPIAIVCVGKFGEDEFRCAEHYPGP